MPRTIKTCGIYTITHVESGHCYVGQSVDCEHRWTGHIRDLRNGRHHSPRLQNSFNKYGEKAFSFAVVELVGDRKQLTGYEQYWMDALKPVFNVCPAAGSVAGIKRSPEARVRSAMGLRRRYANDPMLRARMSALKRGQPSPWKGKHPTEETRLKMSLAKRGKAPFLGKKHTEETKAKISAAKRGTPSTNKGKESPFKGLPRSPEVCAAISAGHKRALAEGRYVNSFARRTPEERHQMAKQAAVARWGMREKE